MPRKYHRPPATKRRKSKKTLPYAFEGSPETEEVEDTELAAAPEELDDEDWPGEAQASVSDEGRLKGRAPTRHLVKDFSYVRGEVVRILVLGTFIVTSLVITALLRNG